MTTDESADPSVNDATERSRQSTDLRVDRPAEQDPADEDGSESDVDPETFRAFWGAVLAVDVGLFCVVAGPVIAYARGWSYVGGIVFLVGLGAFYRAYTTYQGYVDDSDDAPDEEVAP